MRNVIAGAVLILALQLSGCGDVAELVAFADSASEARDLNVRVADLTNTSFGAMPAAGSDSYIGSA